MFKTSEREMESRVDTQHRHPRKPLVAQFRGASERFLDFIEDSIDRNFERTRRQDYGGRIERSELVVDDQAARAHATAYEGTSPRTLRLLFTEARRYMPPFENFFDVGSGKGKTCILAARDGGFRHVSGVELSPPLVEIACENARRAGMPSVEFICGDASAALLRPGAGRIARVE